MGRHTGGVGCPKGATYAKPRGLAVVAGWGANSLDAWLSAILSLSIAGPPLGAGGPIAVANLPGRANFGAVGGTQPWGTRQSTLLATNGGGINPTRTTSQMAPSVLPPTQAEGPSSILEAQMTVAPGYVGFTRPEHLLAPIWVATLAGLWADIASVMREVDA